jgi:hypothetical protein
VHGADRNDWELVRSCNHPDATDDRGLYCGGIDGLIVFLADVASTLSATSHQLCPPHIEVDGVIAHARALYSLTSPWRDQRIERRGVRGSSR